ncbi:hypothetical protein FACS1894137_07050 [Spirochaetia bacterium]|nr:hypothetical protein FACS1894137_07050 [Spirochaetia bacterium]
MKKYQTLKMVVCWGLGFYEINNKIKKIIFKPYLLNLMKIENNLMSGLRSHTYKQRFFLIKKSFLYFCVKNIIHNKMYENYKKYHNQYINIENM